MNLVYPLEKKGVKTSGFGNRKHQVEDSTIHHNGIDIGVPDGTSVISVANGEVVRSDMKDKNGYGNFIIVKHNVDGETFFSCYAHLTKRLVDVGDKVKKGEKIAESGGGQGISGGGGMSTGPHLHFEIRKSVTGGWVNPESYINGAPITKGFGGKENKKDLSDDGLAATLMSIANDYVLKPVGDVLDKSETIKLFKKMAADVEKEYEASDKGMWEQNERLKKIIKKIL